MISFLNYGIDVFLGEGWIYYEHNTIFAFSVFRIRRTKKRLWSGFTISIDFFTKNLTITFIDGVNNYLNSTTLPSKKWY